MHKRKNKTRINSLLLAVLGGLALLPTAMAQPDSGGLLGRGNGLEAANGSLLNGQNRDGLFNVGNEAFGATGSQIGNEPFGAPIEGGAIFLVAAAMGYATLKLKQNKQD